MIDRFLEALRKSVRNYTERELQQQNFDYMEKFRRESLIEKSFYNLSEDEIARMREVVATGSPSASRTSCRSASVG